MNEQAMRRPESRAQAQCEYLAEQYGARVLRPLYESIELSIGEDGLRGMEPPGPDANPVDQARFLVELLGEDEALRAIEGAAREYAPDLQASLQSLLDETESGKHSQHRGRISESGRKGERHDG